MPTIRQQNGQIVYKTPAEFKAQIDAEKAALNLPLDANGKYTAETVGDTYFNIKLWGRNYENVTSGVNTKNACKIYPAGIEIKGLKQDELLTVNKKTWRTEPSRSLNGSLSNINDIDTYIVPVLKFTVALLSIEDYQRLANLFYTFNEFYVQYYDKAQGLVNRLMYPTPEELTKFYNREFNVIGIMDFSIEFVATLNELNYGEDLNNTTN